MKTLLMAAAIGLLASGPAQAATLTLDLADVASFGTFGDPRNIVWSFDLGAGAHITGLSYDLTLTAYGPSWLTELALALSDSALENGFTLTPGLADSLSGTTSYADSLDLVEFGRDFALGTDGLLRLEFWDLYDDGVNPDGRWSGALAIDYTPGLIDPGSGPAVPEPASWALMVAGFGLIGAATRRRRGRSVASA